MVLKRIEISKIYSKQYEGLWKKNMFKFLITSHLWFITVITYVNIFMYPEQSKNKKTNKPFFYSRLRFFNFSHHPQNTNQVLCCLLYQSAIIWVTYTSETAYYILPTNLLRITNMTTGFHCDTNVQTFSLFHLKINWCKNIALIYSNANLKNNNFPTNVSIISEKEKKM